jgi:acyl-[acyl-carrier-protein]-phospholipid O-acyltransferase / long-chain-fatty-acid--[acyl-carrier-protein] ligase
MAVDQRPKDDQQRRIVSASFLGYLTMIFLTALNDNMFRWLIIPLAKQQIATDTSLTVDAAQQAESVILAMGLGCIVLPFVVFAPWSGWLADRFSKRTVTIWLKIAEVILIGFGLWTIQLGNNWLTFLVLLTLGTQSALLSTTKFGIIPELVPRSALSLANGLVGMVTLVAVIAGTVAGNWLATIVIADLGHGLTVSAVCLLTAAVLGVGGAMFVVRTPAANPLLKCPINPITRSWRDLQLVFRDRPIFRVTLGVTFFWSLASLAQMNIDTFVTHELLLEQTQVGIFLAVLSLGVGIGSVLAGWWSGGRVELGMVPLGTLIMAASCVLLFFSSASPILTGIMLVAIGLGGGLFNVPLNAYIQERSPHHHLGAILAAGHQLTAFGMLLVAAAFPLLRGGITPAIEFSAAQIFLIAGLGTFPILIYVLWLLPQATVRFLVWLLSRFVYRVRIHGLENIPETGSALLVANHVTWIDGILILLSSSRPIRMIAYADYVRGRVLSRLASLFEIIPIRSGDGPRALLKSLNTARDALKNGELVCIFAEGRITRSGRMQKFERGMLKILKGTDAPVIPVCLDELWGSVFSYDGGRFLWKKPRHWPYPVSISFGSAISSVGDVNTVRNAVLDLSIQSIERRKQRSMIPAKRFIRQCRLAWSRTKVADSAGAELTGGRLLTGSLAFRNLLVKSVLKDDDSIVGILLPPSAGGVVANAALTLAGRVSANLNYTLTEDVVNYCIREAGIKQILTSRRFLEKRPFNLDAELIHMEDLKEQVSGFAKLQALMTARLMPFGMLCKRLGLNGIGPDDLLSIIFTSGSTGEPKGVMLSHNNIASNLESVNQVLHLHSRDMIMGVLPFFHSFGYTVTLWLPLCADPGVVQHFNPLDARIVGKLVRKYKASILGVTPTFLRSYMKRCDHDDLKSLNLVIVGAEKLPPDLAEEFKEQFGFYPTEGYGTTELSPVASFNVPESRMGVDTGQDVGTKMGSVGRVIPGSAAAVFDVDTGERLGVDQEGLLKIKGPNVMLGYLQQPEKTAESIHDGWYNTGDMGMIDDDGFIRITGRMSRFSKIGGEMVPHILVEQHLTRIVEDKDSDEPELQIAVTSVPDKARGERLIVLHKPLDQSVRDVIDALKQTGIPNLWIPSRDSFLEVEQIPMLGTGKLDLRGLKQAAEQHYAPKAG